MCIDAFKKNPAKLRLIERALAQGGEGGKHRFAGTAMEFAARRKIPRA